MKNKKRSSALILLFSLFAFTGTSFAATVSNASGTGKWTEPIWDKTPADDHHIYIGVADTLDAPNTVTTNNTIISALQFRIGGRDNSAAVLNVGEGAGSNSTITVSMDVSVGRSAGSNGTLNLYEGGSIIYTGTDATYAGVAGTGFINIAGGNLTTTKLTFGGNDDSKGTLNMTAGKLNVTGDTVIGNKARSQGNLIISDGNATMSNVYLGNGASSSGGFKISGGNVTLGGILNLGAGGSSSTDFEMTKGTLTFTATSATGGDIRIASYGTSTANFRMSNGTITTNSRMIVGMFGKGTAIVEDGSITVGNGLFVGNKSSSEGTLTLKGGSISVTGADGTKVGTDQGSKGTINIEGGTLRATDISVGLNNDVTASMTLSGSGKVSASGNVNIGNATASGATTTFSAKGGSELTIDGALTLASDGSTSVTKMIIAGQAQVTAATLSMSGDAKLVFEISDDSFSGKLVLTDSLGSSLFESGASILIDLGSFSGDTSVIDGMILMSYVGSNSDLENIVSINAGSTGLDFAWKNGNLMLQSIPEPSAYAAAIAGLALVWLAISRRRRNR